MRRVALILAILLIITSVNILSFFNVDIDPIAESISSVNDSVLFHQIWKVF